MRVAIDMVRMLSKYTQITDESLNVLSLKSGMPKGIHTLCKCVMGSKCGLVIHSLGENPYIHMVDIKLTGQ